MLEEFPSNSESMFFDRAGLITCWYDANGFANLLLYFTATCLPAFDLQSNRFNVKNFHTENRRVHSNPLSAIFSMIRDARWEWNNYCRVLFGNLKISAWVIKPVAFDINKLWVDGKCFIINTRAQPPGIDKILSRWNVRNYIYDWSPDSETVVRMPRPRTRP